VIFENIFLIIESDNPLSFLIPFLSTSNFLADVSIALENGCSEALINFNSSAEKYFLTSADSSRLRYLEKVDSNNVEPLSFDTESKGSLKLIGLENQFVFFSRFSNEYLFI